MFCVTGFGFILELNVVQNISICQLKFCTRAFEVKLNKLLWLWIIWWHLRSLAIRYCDVPVGYIVDWLVYRNANLCWCFADDHHPPPTFTPPELPKKVHVRGTSQDDRLSVFFLICFSSAHFSIERPAMCFVHKGALHLVALSRILIASTKRKSTK